jgi:glycosyltransferase involved in cell wall biosynthesis
MISVIILTKNEEKDLSSCINSIKWCNDIHVVDSGSSDATIDIAKKLGANVYVNDFKSFAQQRNWALDNCSAIYDWILFLDADEHSTVAFKNAIEKAVFNAQDNIGGFYCCCKTILNQKWLKRSDNFPKWQFRLLRRQNTRFIDIGHGQKEGKVGGKICYIKDPYLHFPFSHGLEAWSDKHLRYAKKDAYQTKSAPVNLSSFIAIHGSTRNVAIKGFMRRLPGWPLLRFCYSYILRGGFTEGHEGLTYCRKMLWYERQVRKQLRSLNQDDH